MRVLHFSDVHIDTGVLAARASEWASKRLLGGANLLLRRRRHYARATEKLRALAQLAETESVELALCTGDYTALGTEPELRAAREAVQPFLALPHGLATVPGNHDLYTVRGSNDGRFERCFGDLLKSDLPELRRDGPWPLVRLAGDRVAVVALNSARPNPAPWIASGRIPEAALAVLPELLAHPRLAGRFVFVMTHYAPRLEHGGPDSRWHGLENADQFLRACASLRRGAVLHGHVHRTFRVRVPELEVPLYGAGSSTMEHREGGWLFEVGEGKDTVRRLRWEGDAWKLGAPENL